jgi:hypothetical protein
MKNSRHEKKGENSDSIVKKVKLKNAGKTLKFFALDFLRVLRPAGVCEAGRPVEKIK